MSIADLLPVTVRFDTASAGLSARACQDQTDGWDAAGQTIHLDLRRGETAAGARAWAALAEPARGLELCTYNMPPDDVLLLAATETTTADDIHALVAALSRRTA